MTAEQDRARLAGEITAFFPRRGPCLACGVPGEDARHRLTDELADHARAGAHPAAVGAAYGVPERAVYVALIATEADSPQEWRTA